MKVGASKLKNGEAASYSSGSEKRGAVPGASETARTFEDVAVDVESRALIEELDRIGAELSRFPAAALLERYRELVRAALARVKNGARIKREFKWRRTERSMFMVIERAEDALAELESLGSALDRERERTRLFELMDEIKGCLISLLF